MQKNPIAVQDGNFVLEEGQCSQNGALTRCPEKLYDPENPTDAGYCGAGTASSCPPISRAPSQGKAA